MSCRENEMRASMHTVVPLPQSVEMKSGYLRLKSQVSVKLASAELKPALEIIKTALPGIDIVTSDEAHIVLTVDSSFSEEAYSLLVDENISVKGGSYRAVVWGIVSALQMIVHKDGLYSIPKCAIRDEPYAEYRAFMLDVARQWHELPTIRQLIDLCSWYKIRYMQLHLSDNESFTFPSKAFLELPTPGRHYTIEELQDLVRYAETRGVTLIPEFDGPGHTLAMREALPDLFGEPDLGIINIADERALRAVETIIAEMMDVFYTSPYFHIGADEAWLEPFSKNEDAIKAVQQNDFTDVHDLYLQYMVRMHKFVKSKGKQTLIWESFDGDGSEKVKIPKDILVIAWETLYQRPDSLVREGYKIINASWKPTYVTPGRRWNTEYIYHWNIWRWENFWEITPAYKAPIQLAETSPVVGGQMCSWEMSEAMELSGVRPRLPALSENIWNPKAQKDYAYFARRLQHTDSVFAEMVFPAKDQSVGFANRRNDDLLSDNGDRYSFNDSLVIMMEPVHPGHSIRYTLDKTIPDTTSSPLIGPIILHDTQEVRFGIFDHGNRVGYKVINYTLSPLRVNFSGITIPQRDLDLTNPVHEFTGMLTVEIEDLNKEGTIRYTTDGDIPGSGSLKYSSPLSVDSTMRLMVQYFDSSGEPLGRLYKFHLRKSVAGAR